MTGPLAFFGIVAVVLFAGVADASPPKQIVNGTKAALGEFPYMVSVGYRVYHFCGGVIVGPRHIVTAAHCVYGYENPSPSLNNLYVATGSVFSNGGRKRKIDKILVHPGYDFASSDSLHDIAIIVLRVDIAFNKNQHSIRLPTSLVPEDVLATVTEWLLPFRDGLVHTYAYTELVKINVRTRRADSCNSSFAGTADIGESLICSLGGNGVDGCARSGGALTYDGQLSGIGGRYTACSKGYPNVYTNVFHYVDWIKETMKE